MLAVNSQGSLQAGTAVNAGPMHTSAAAAAAAAIVLLLPICRLPAGIY
jgi:hypothetical protein